MLSYKRLATVQHFKEISKFFQDVCNSNHTFLPDFRNHSRISILTLLESEHEVQFYIIVTSSDLHRRIGIACLQLMFHTFYPYLQLVTKFKYFC